jgi:hypothetical protein
MIRRGALFATIWWYWFHRSTSGSVYACLIWNVMLRRVL